jgi:hypothetical protein
MTISEVLSAPVSFIVHTLADVNKQLEKGRPFFVDLVRQGIALYEAEGFAFAAPRRLPAEKPRAEAQDYFDRWFESAGRYIATGLSHTTRGWLNEAAFELHQGTERLYHCALLVLTLQPEVTQAKLPAFASGAGGAAACGRLAPRGEEGQTLL